MKRTPGNGRSTTGHGGIFDEDAFSGPGLRDHGDHGYDERSDGIGYIDAAEASDGEHLLRKEDRDALAIGRGILSAAKALSNLAQAAVVTSNVAVGDISRHGLRGALVRGLQRVSKSIEAQDHVGEYVPQTHRWAGADPEYFGASGFVAEPAFFESDRDETGGGIFDGGVRAPSFHYEAASATARRAFEGEPIVRRVTRPRAASAPSAEWPPEWRDPRSAFYRPFSTMREPTPMEEVTEETACNTLPDDDRFAPCTRGAGHAGPCAHRLAADEPDHERRSPAQANPNTGANGKVADLMDLIDRAADEDDDEIFEAVNETAAGQPMHDVLDDEIANRDLDEKAAAP